ncbi:hypothetical protein WJ96_06075 [Burkholderia ubonensis]|uniref:Uncharacterized protein n=1 Tax=Burkholderia ubonensis TaxID=101571 RepID=A0AAW3MU53_9BURK|nr:hypothetical protein WJ97_13000 [Burkholderia ubonensis]KVP98137.1 hypothetical protein WJ96_06075 [Burkholderia ubonensis]KVZ92834.1 hypothetical protein WL25_17735 [Burkholderia ubonensis]
MKLRFPKATSRYTATGAIVYDEATDAELGQASAGDWAVEHAWVAAANKLQHVSGPLTDEWMPWADKLIRSVRHALDNGIPAEVYAGYPSPAEGFFFELHADLPYGRPVFLADVKANLEKMPEFQELDAQVRQKFGFSILGGKLPTQ